MLLAPAALAGVPVGAVGAHPDAVQERRFVPAHVSHTDHFAAHPSFHQPFVNLAPLCSSHSASNALAVVIDPPSERTREQCDTAAQMVVVTGLESSGTRSVARELAKRRL